MAYRDVVLQVDEPRLNDMVIKLREIAAREKQFGSSLVSQMGQAPILFAVT